MDEEWFGTEGVTAEDRAYAGSRFAEVETAIFADPYQPVWGAPGAPPWPPYKLTLRSLLSGLLSRGPYQFRAATERAVDSGADLRWGAGHKGYRRLLHPNGICLTGIWEIDADTPYSGYFRHSSRALIVARYSASAVKPGAATPVRYQWSASCSQPPIPTMPNRCAPRTSSRSRTLVATTRTSSTTLRSVMPATSPPSAAELASGASWSPVFIRTRRRRACNPPALSDRRTRQAAGRADACTAVHAPAGRSGAAAYFRRRARFPRRNHGADLRSRRSDTQAQAALPHRGHQRRRKPRTADTVALDVPQLASDRQHHLRLRRRIIYRRPCAAL